jgi:hypothetical protein
MAMHTKALDARISLVARRQAGAFTWSQARACGFGKATIGRRLDSGQWERVHPGVHVIAGVPPTRTLPGRGPVRGLVDAAYPDARIVIEADGRTYHTRVADMRRDRERDAQVVKAGWVTMRFIYSRWSTTPRPSVPMSPRRGQSACHCSRRQREVMGSAAASPRSLVPDPERNYLVLT